MMKRPWKNKELKQVYKQLTFLQGHARHTEKVLDTVLAREKLSPLNLRYVRIVREKLLQHIENLENQKDICKERDV